MATAVPSVTAWGLGFALRRLHPPKSPCRAPWSPICKERNDAGVFQKGALSDPGGRSRGRPAPPAALQGPGETPAGLELWASPGSRTQEALQQLLKVAERAPAPHHLLGMGASSNLSHPLPPGCSGFKQVSFEELNSGASTPPPPESVRCAHQSASRDWRVGRWGGVTQWTHLATRTSAR